MIHVLLAVALMTAPDDLTSRLDEVVFRLPDATSAQTWDIARELTEIADEDTIAAVPHLVALAKSASPAKRLVLARVLVDVDAPDEAARLLLPLLDADAVAAEALVVLSEKGFRDVPDVSDALEARLAAPRPPAERIDLATTLYKVSRGSARMRAREILLDTLGSDDPETRALGALALAEIKHYEEARPVLMTLRADPGPRGRLARAYIDSAESKDYWQRKFLRESETSVPLAVPRETGLGSLDVLEEIMTRVADVHELGDDYASPEGRERLVTAAAKGMLTELDPYSTYFSPEEFERWMLDLRRNYAGIGAYVDTIDQIFTITRPIYGGPAYGVGLLSGDKILKVDGWETFGHTNEEIIKRLKGEPGTEVKVTVYRRGWQDDRDVVIAREVINIPSVHVELLPGRIGYVDVSQFADGTHLEIMSALRDLHEQDVQGLVLDLRNNTGGYLREAVRIASIFLQPEQLIVYTEGRGQPKQEYRSRPMEQQYFGPLVVLMNEQSASASEIVAGAIKDHARARVIGERSFGKGSVQQAMELEARPGDRFVDSNYNQAYDPGEPYEDADGNGKFSYGGQIKLTNARYFLPSGRSIHTLTDIEGRIVEQGGIVPDVELEFAGLEGWETNELAIALDGFEENPFETYVEDRWDEHEALFTELAHGDAFDTSRYPDFEAFRESLGAHVSDDVVRKYLRHYVRRRVADARGRAFPGGFLFGDWQEDNQLRVAIAALDEEMPDDLALLESYRDLLPEARAVIESHTADAR